MRSNDLGAKKLNTWSSGIYGSGGNNGELRDAEIRITLRTGSDSNTVVRLFQRDRTHAFTSRKIDDESKTKFIDKIISFGKLEKDWDGHSGTPPKKSTIDDAITLLKHLPNYAHPARIGISGDGEISFFWEGDNNFFADIGVVGDGSYSFFISNNNTKLYGDELPISEGIDREVLELLQK